MAYKIISGAVQADANICNMLTVDPPKIGVHVGGGIHVTIPPDWQARCVAGEKIPGCTYAAPIAHYPNAIQAIIMVVTPEAEANQAIPANVAGANVSELINFRNKLANATVGP